MERDGQLNIISLHSDVTQAMDTPNLASQSIKRAALDFRLDTGSEWRARRARARC